ncbi:MAG: hypothetical protein A3K19_22540 [Lentisphaerae bacterium RIFOXYB12_FULL_65_16]|nr:MAG: hypothetical protein A3K18_17515 [Lentisphaerae bacterium RIFOXYA12_64_32]OGV92900.1 MAG: hypothetical protein A3K19_22540 [Lentisphaerae bacterium RIFOXYB12_FULL_65_16]
MTCHTSVILRALCLAAMPLLAWLPSARAFDQQMTVREDAQDGDTAGWDVYDQTQPGTITNVVDPADAANRLIRLQGGGCVTGYRLTFPTSSTVEFKVQWRMRFSEFYVIYIGCSTTAGYRYLYYTPEDSSYLGAGTEVQHGLGVMTKNGRWSMFRRDVQRDLWDAQPTANIISVNTVLIRGSGCMDDIRTYDYADADRDLLPDETEMALGLNPQDATDGHGDLDSDGAENAREFVLGTGLTDADSDDDGLNDGAEINTWGSDPLVQDTDQDGLTDGVEVTHSMDPLRPAVQGNGYTYEATVLENAEDGNAAGWDVYTGSSTGTVTNVADPVNAANRTIRVQGNATASGYRYTFPTPAKTGFKLEWRLRYSEFYVIFVSCTTTAGHRYVYYSSENPNYLGSGEYVHHGLGASAYNGTWTTFRRDIQRDLWDAQPTVNILSISAFLICGSGYVDDLTLLAYADGDRDLVPDDVETAAGLNPNSPSDAHSDADADGLDNLRELLLGTGITDADTDDDGLGDGLEVNSYGSDPFDSDTDDDGIPDGAEVEYGMDPLQPAIQGNGFKYEATVQEDAEDGNTAGWEIYASISPSTITNEADPANAANRAIRLQGAPGTGFRYWFPAPDEAAFKLQWRMRFSEQFFIFVNCNTTAGHRYLYYTSDSADPLGNTEYVHHGLGAVTQSGRWVTVRRDLQRDLWDTQPTVNILSVTAFLVWGSGYFDDITTLAYADVDRDLIPDAIETAAGLDPEDPADALSDDDSDGLTNAAEFLAGTDMFDPDSDHDGLNDGIEFTTYGTDLLDPDTDGDGLSDGVESGCGMDPLTPATQGPGYSFEKRVIEDAEDGDTAGWDLFDADPPGTLANAPDPDNAPNRVIQFQATFDTGFRFTVSPYEARRFVLEWRMRVTGNYLIYATCYTSVGWLNVRYVPSTASPNLGLDPIVALGPELANGEWVTVRRDLLADVQRLHAGASILGFYGFMVRAAGCVDDVALLAYPDADHDRLPDSVETAAGLDPSDPADGAGDADGDGLTNLDEFMRGTQIGDADSDHDNLNDGPEVNSWGSDPLAEDTDNDGLIDGWEVAHGMDPLKPAVQGDGYMYEFTVQEDAEDGDTAGWDVYDQTQPGTVTNVVDPDNPSNRLIRLLGGTRATGYRLTFAKPERFEFKLQWRMRYSEDFTIYVSCSTTAGHRYIYYTAAETDDLGTGEYVAHGLGTASKSGVWMKIRRDLQRDIWDAQPDVDIISVDAFLVRGSGYLDDIVTYAYADADRDLIPDETETAAGLEPDDPADGAADLDGDGLSNADEIAWGTDLQAADSDGDGIPDGNEVNLGLDPTVPYTGPDLMHAATEVTDAEAGLVASYYKGDWRYLPSFEFFPHYGSGVVTQLDMAKSTGQVFDSGRTDTVGAVFAGWIGVPADGWYTFHLTNDDGAFLYIDNMRVAGTDGYVWHLGEPWQSQGDIGLRGGKHALRIEYFETYGNAALVLEWEAIGLVREAVPAVNLFHSPAYLQQMQASDDSDGDGLSDVAENAAGSDPAKMDTDGEGLMDGMEVNELGTNPLSADTDSDGVSDFDEAELVLSNPLVPDIDAVPVTEQELNGSDGTVLSGTWHTRATELCAVSKRGEVAFQLAVAAAGCYRVEIQGTQFLGNSTYTAFSIIGHIDDEYVGTAVLNAPFGTSGTIQFHTPWLLPGNHTARVLWDNVYEGTSLDIQAVRLQKAGGPDTDGNGRPDWIDHRLAVMCSLDAVAATSKVSPLCIEGIAHFLSGMSISDGTPVKRATWRRWHADLPLSEAGPTAATVSFQNGASAAAVSTAWVATNVLSEPDLTLRKGDALRLIALPEGATGGTVQITVGADTFSTTLDAPVLHRFEAAGIFVVNGTCTPPEGAPVTGSMQVTVVECSQPEAPAIWRDRERTWTWNGLPPVAVLDAAQISLSQTARSENSASFQLRRSEVIEDVHLVARLGAGGPILASVPTDGFWLRSAVEGHVVSVEQYPDNSDRLEVEVFTGGLPASVHLNIKVFPTGISFDDGAIERNVLPSDFNAAGWYIYYMLRADMALSICRITTVYQGSEIVGELN